MIVRNITQDIVHQRWYRAHVGARATMLFSSGELQGLLFFAHAELEPGREIEIHLDPYEEIYYLVSGTGLIRVGEEEQQVNRGDAIWLPFGVPHGLKNNGTETCIFVVAASEPE